MSSSERQRVDEVSYYAVRYIGGKVGSLVLFDEVVVLDTRVPRGVQKPVGEVTYIAQEFGPGEKKRGSESVGLAIGESSL
jgi:hypothetical protein